jgi:hypothetical protein
VHADVAGVDEQTAEVDQQALDREDAFEQLGRGLKDAVFELVDRSSSGSSAGK